MKNVITKHLTKINKGKKGDNDKEFIILHFVGAKGQAWDNADYFYDTYRGSSANYFVDPKDILQVVEDDTPAWAIGDGQRTGKGKYNGYHNKGGATNTNSIHIEMCQDPSTGDNVWNWEFHPDTVEKTEWLVRKLQKDHNISDSHVIRHFDASGKNCPGNWSDNAWAQWHAFKDRLEKDIKQPAPSAKPKDEGKDSHLEELMHLVEVGETVGSIAKDHKVKVADIVEWNKLSNKNLIFPETKLFVKKPPVRDKPVTNPATPTVAPKPAPVKKTVDQLAKEVIDGKHGSGTAREKSLGNQHAAVQKRVNELLGAKAKPAPKAKPPVKSIATLVDEVNRGVHGSGRERMLSLGNRYTEVQREVNRRSR